MRSKDGVAVLALLHGVVQRPIVFIGGDVRAFHDLHFYIRAGVAGDVIKDHGFAAAKILGKPGVDF